MPVVELPSRWSHRRARLASVLGACVMLLVAAVVVPAAHPVGAAGADAGTPDGAVRVGLVVDLGDGRVLELPVTLDGPADGITVLQSAGLAPSVRGFGGLGAAVCALTIDGTQMGCPTGADCLVCAEPSYWVYFRASAGASGFTMSRVGAGAVEVRDGDVEGWRWGTGAPPRFRAFDAFFPPAVTTTVPATTPRTTASTVPPTTVPSVRTTAPPPPTTPTSGAMVAPVAAAAPSSTAPTGGPTTGSTTPRTQPPGSRASAPPSAATRPEGAPTSAPGAPAAVPDGATASGPPPVATPEPGSRAGWAFAAVGAVLLAALVLGARRRRAAPVRVPRTP